MDRARVDFGAIAWKEVAPGMHCKVAVREGTRLRLTRITPGFEEPDGCPRAHAGYVLEGTLEVRFADRTETFRTGDGLLIAGGERERHRSTPLGGSVLLVLVDPEEAGPDQSR